MNPDVKEISEENRKIKCDFCHSSHINSLEWGPMYKLDGVSVHYFCMLFSAGLSQNGEDDEGILGFFPRDIKKELRRGEKLKCKFCREPNATIGCSVKTCKLSYHFRCGLQAGSNFQFIGNYESYCSKHKEVPDIPLPKSEWYCPICYNEVKKDPLWPPCCKKKVFHKLCIMEMARHHGAHFFKCPLCNDKDAFTVAMRRLGVYLPDQDASWESVPNAFADHTRQYSTCDAETCLCPKGKNYSSKSDGKPWKVIRCGACGASGIHVRCGNLQNLTWRCPTCADILSDKRKNVTLNTSRIRRHVYDTSDEDEEELPVISVREAISENASIAANCEYSRDSESELSRGRQVFNPVYGKRFLVDPGDTGGDSEDSEESDNEEDSMFIAAAKRTEIGKRLRETAAEMVSGEQSKVHSSRTKNKKPGLREALKNLMNSQTVRDCPMNFDQDENNSDLSFKQHPDQFNPIKMTNSNSGSDDNSRVNIFKIKLSSSELTKDVPCCQQSSSSESTPSLTDNVSTRIVPIRFSEFGKDKLIKTDSRKLSKEKVVIESKEVISESTTSQSVKISRSGIYIGDNDQESSSPTIKNLEQRVRNAYKRRKDTSKHQTFSALIKSEVEDGVVDLDEESGSDVEILEEKIVPTANSKSAAIMEMVRQGQNKGKVFVRSPPVVRLGIDDDQNDKIESIVSIKNRVPPIGFSEFRTSDSSIPISSAFLQLLQGSKRPIPKSSSSNTNVDSMEVVNLSSDSE